MATTKQLTEDNFDSDAEFRGLTAHDISRRLLLREGYMVIDHYGHHVVRHPDGSAGCYSADQLVELACSTMCEGHGDALLARNRRDKRSSIRARFAGINLAIRPKKRRSSR